MLSGVPIAAHGSAGWEGRLPPLVAPHCRGIHRRKQLESCAATDAVGALVKAPTPPLRADRQAAAAECVRLRLREVRAQAAAWLGAAEDAAPRPPSGPRPPSCARRLRHLTVHCSPSPPSSAGSGGEFSALRPTRPRLTGGPGVPEGCWEALKASGGYDKRRAITLVLALRRLGKRNGGSSPLCTDLIGETLEFLMRPTDMPRVLIVQSEEIPALCGRYTVLSRVNDVNGMPVWSCGRRRLFSSRQGYWSVVHGEENMRDGVAALVGAAPHRLSGPHQVSGGWLRGMCDGRPARKTTIREPQASAAVFLSPDS
eukprot:TRINITY_DN16409_c0_g1_i1.p1 TRINITY_DN16409_c0_g1~~TRINITY_DN16409_c0_g1_i1.p1  ORF type:complete len:313 (+),score=72.47 TRINITY_DN16409_c0_g1_i1:86-1024(+)